MLKFFRRIRYDLMENNKTTQYLKYAVGEIVLVVIGILIALQINNANEERKERTKEVGFLSNLKVDLINDLENNKYFANYRFKTASTCSSLLNTAAPNNVEEVREYTVQFEQVFNWVTFVPNNNTFKELLSSGNLSLINNKAITNGLLDLDKRYSSITSGEHHMRREYEQYLYDVHVKNIAALQFFDTRQPKYGLLNRLNVEDIPKSLHKKLIEDTQWQHNNQTFNNGIKLAMMNNSLLASLHRDISKHINQLLKVIDAEINK